MTTHYHRYTIPLMILIGHLTTLHCSNILGNEPITRHYIASIPHRIVKNEEPLSSLKMLEWYGTEEYWLRRQEISGDDLPNSYSSLQIEQNFTAKHSGVFITVPLCLPNYLTNSSNSELYDSHEKVQTSLENYLPINAINNNIDWYEVKYVNQSKPSRLPIITFLRNPVTNDQINHSYGLGYSTNLPIPLTNDEYQLHSYLHVKYSLYRKNTLLDLDYSIRIKSFPSIRGVSMSWYPEHVMIEPPVNKLTIDSIDKLYFTRFDEAGNAFIQKDPIDDRNEVIPAYPRPNASDTENETQIEGLNSDNWWYRQHELESSEWQQKNPNLNYRDYIVRSYIYGEYPFQPEEDQWYGHWKKSYPGWVFDQFWPWVWTDHLGWVYTYGFDASSIWLYSTEMQFLWTSETAYPWVYSHSLSKWLYVGFQEEGLRTGDTVLFDPESGELHFILNKPQ